MSCDRRNAAVPQEGLGLLRVSPLQDNSAAAVSADELYERRKVEKLKATMARCLVGSRFLSLSSDSQFLALALCAEGWLTAANDIGHGHTNHVGEITQKARAALAYPLDLDDYRVSRSQPNPQHAPKTKKAKEDVVLLLEDKRPGNPGLP